jgi:hypothetical protein
MQAHDNTFPPAAKWCEALSPYLEAPEDLTCPEAPTEAPAYAYNAALSGLPRSALKGAIGRLVVFFESDVSGCAAGGPELMTRRPRHYGRYELIVFADGHFHLYFMRKNPPADALRWSPVVSKGPCQSASKTDPPSAANIDPPRVVV